jgi:hypothetical protein
LSGPDGSFEVDVLLVPHLGSSNNVNIEFFRRVKAWQYLFTSSGRFGIPKEDVFQMILARRDDARIRDKYVLLFLNRDGTQELGRTAGCVLRVPLVREVRLPADLPLGGRYLDLHRFARRRAILIDINKGAEKPWITLRQAAACDLCWCGIRNSISARRSSAACTTITVATCSST